MLRKIWSNQMTTGDILMMFRGGGDATVFRVAYGMPGLKQGRLQPTIQLPNSRASLALKSQEPRQRHRAVT